MMGVIGGKIRSLLPSMRNPSTNRVLRSAWTERPSDGEPAIPMDILVGLTGTATPLESNVRRVGGSNLSSGCLAGARGSMFSHARTPTLALRWSRRATKRACQRDCPTDPADRHQHYRPLRPCSCSHARTRKVGAVSFFLGRPSKVIAGLTASVILVLTHVGSVVVLVLTGLIIIRGTIGGAGRAPEFETASAAFIVLVGLGRGNDHNDCCFCGYSCAVARAHCSSYGKNYSHPRTLRASTELISAAAIIRFGLWLLTSRPKV